MYKVFLFFIFANHCLLFSETRYKINNLELNQTHSYAYCINNHGEVCGTFNALNSGGGYNSAFYWSPDMGLIDLPEGEFFTPNNMNDAGMITGNKGLFKGYMIDVKGSSIDLGNYHPQSINNNNISVGSYVGGTSRMPYQKVQENGAESIKCNYNDNLNLAERYRTKKRRCKRVESIVSAINNLNEIVGTVTAYGVPIIGIPDGCISHAFLLRGAEMIEIGKNYSAVDINDKSQVLLVETGKTCITSFVWDNGNFTPLWNGGWPKAINNNGSVVGFSLNGAAVVWENGKVNLLYDLLENPEGWEKLCVAEDINDRGEIVGYGIYEGCQAAFLLTPCK